MKQHACIAIEILVIVLVCFCLLTYQFKKPVEVELKDNAGVREWTLGYDILSEGEVNGLGNGNYDTNLYRDSNRDFKLDDNFKGHRWIVEADGEIRSGCGVEGCFGRCPECGGNKP